MPFGLRFSEYLAAGGVLLVSLRSRHGLHSDLYCSRSYVFVDFFSEDLPLARLRPGAFGLFLRGDSSFAALTNASSRSFGTARSARMTSLKCLNAGVESNGPSLINSLSGREVSSRAPVALYSSEAHSCYGFFCFASELFVSYSASNNLLHDGGESFRISHAAIVETECLFINVTE